MMVIYEKLSHPRNEVRKAIMVLDRCIDFKISNNQARCSLEDGMLHVDDIRVCVKK
jgi:hypothetical protein